MTGLPRRRVIREPVYRWTIKDFRMGTSTNGEAPSAARAQADAVAQLKRIGRGLTGLQATVWRPSGGGWFARSAPRSLAFTWEEFEVDRG